jgi:hypothetical protein
MTDRVLTERQQKFLDVLFDEAEGDFVAAKRLAGYSETVRPSSIVKSLEDEIAELTKKYLVNHGAKAAAKMVSVLDNPTRLGNKEIIAASKDILDRAGHKPKDKVEVETDLPVFYLPEKNHGEDKE